MAAGRTMKVAVVGGGVTGLAAAYTAVEGGAEVVVYEKEDYSGGHANTVTQLDLGFMGFNQVTYPNMMEFLERLGVDMEPSDMSFSVSLDCGKGYEWGSRNGFSSLFAQKKNALNPYFWKMISEIVKFKKDVLIYLEKLDNNPDIDRNETLGDFVRAHGFSELFQQAYLIPICRSIWPCSTKEVMSFAAYSVLSFCCNHHLHELFSRPQWLTFKWHSQDYVNKVREVLQGRGSQIRTSSEVCRVSSDDGGCTITCKDGSIEMYDCSIIATHAPNALDMLGDGTTFDERRILGAFQYTYSSHVPCSNIFLHHDKNFMPQNPSAWSAWNFLGSVDDKVCVTYWLNILQNINESGLPFLVTLNPSSTPQHTLLKWSTRQLIPSVAAIKASSKLDLTQGKRRTWFCGVYGGYDSHEEGLKAGLLAAHSVLRKSYALVNNPKRMVLSWLETGARLLITRFLEQFIATGCLVLLETGGTMFTFEGKQKKSLLKVSLRIHSPQFYWKVATEADLGLVDAYINGDFSFANKNEGLLNLFMILVANRDLSSSTSNWKSKRGWWTPLFCTSAVASAKYYFQHLSRHNTLTQARHNISRHYDLAQTEDLKIAQLRKISTLIDKARINKHHKVLEIGCGWGTLAIEVVKQSGCKYTGITLSEQQL